MVKHTLVLLVLASCGHVLKAPPPKPVAYDSGPLTRPERGLAICAPGDTCAFRCPQGRCAVECQRGSSCYATCSGGSCTQRCAAGAACEFTCSGAQCGQVAQAGATMRASCAGGGCERSLDEDALQSTE